MANGFFARLSNGLTKTKEGVVKGINNVLSNFSSVDEDFYEELEEVLIMADIGVTTTDEILTALREKVKEQHMS